MAEKIVTTANPKVGGAVSVAPVGTTMPTDAKTALGSGFVNLGYISEDGITDSNSRTSDNIKAWGGQVVYTYQSEKTDTYKYTLIESINVDVLKQVYGDDNVTGDLSSGIVIKSTADELDEHAYVIDEVLKGGILMRTCIPRGKVSAVDDSTHSSSSALSYATTITCLPDSDGLTHTTYIVQPE